MLTTARPVDRRGLNAGVAALVKQLIEAGPDIPTVARRLGQYKETVRYRYKRFLVERGYPVQALVNHERLGLRRVVATLEFIGPYKHYANEILTSMNNTCYVNGFEKTLVEGFYVIHASVPSEFVDDFDQLFRTLEAEGVFKVRGFQAFDVYRAHPMRAEFYDFVKDRWDYDWTPVLTGNGADLDLASLSVSTTVPFDYDDLLVLEELQMDATMPISVIAEKTHTNLKTLHWHFRKHVIGKGLIKEYRVRWLGTRYEPKTDRIFHRRHRYIRVDMVADNLTDVEKMEMVAMARRIPFLWADAIGKGYYAQFAFPLEMMVEAYEYVGRVLSKFSDKVRLFITDQSNAVNFTISYTLFDREKRRWTFDGKLASRYVALAEKIREGGPGLARP